MFCVLTCCRYMCNVDGQNFTTRGSHRSAGCVGLNKEGCDQLVTEQRKRFRCINLQMWVKERDKEINFTR